MAALIGGRGSEIKENTPPLPAGWPPGRLDGPNTRA
jgi:hypothetical protein